MSRKYHWNNEKYKAILVGSKKDNVISLRSLVKGFDARDGYDVTQVASWTPYQKSRVRDFFKRTEILQAQPKRIVRARGANLKKLQDSFHGTIPSKLFKVAFIPDTEPHLALPGAKARPPRVRILKEGVSIERPQYERVFIPFNQKSLVTNAREHIKRIADKIPEAKLFFVQVGEYQSLTGKSIGLLTQQVLDWMQKYDGKKALPRTSGNYGDDPRHHNWRQWLNGLVGYVLPKKMDIKKLGRMIYEGRVKNRAIALKRKNLMRRERIKGRK